MMPTEGFANVSQIKRRKRGGKKQLQLPDAKQQTLKEIICWEGGRVKAVSGVQSRGFGSAGMRWGPPHSVYLRGCLQHPAAAGGELSCALPLL